MRSRSTSGSGVRMPPSSPVVSGESSDSANLFWPTTVISPRSIFASRSRLDSTSWAFMYGTASTAPPCSATCAISSRAPSASSSVRPSITTEPSKMSG